MYLKGIKECCA